MKTIHLFLMRGLVREQAHWENFPSELIAEGERQKLKLKVSFLEIPGSGIYHKTNTPLNIPNIVRWMRRDFLSQAVPGENNILLAVSLGGMISTEWLTQFPEDFQAAVLINTSLRGVNPIHWRLKPKQVLHLLKIAKAPSIEAKERLILDMVSNNNDAKAKAQITWPIIQRARPVGLLNSARQLIAAATYRAPSKAPVLPILFLNSSADKMVDARCTESIARLWKKDLKTHATAGHDLTLDAPNWVASESIEWIKKQQI